MYAIVDLALRCTSCKLHSLSLPPVHPAYAYILAGIWENTKLHRESIRILLPYSLLRTSKKGRCGPVHVYCGDSKGSGNVSHLCPRAKVQTWSIDAQIIVSFIRKVLQIVFLCSLLNTPLICKYSRRDHRQFPPPPPLNLGTSNHNKTQPTKWELCKAALNQASTLNPKPHNPFQYPGLYLGYAYFQGMPY